MTLNLVPRPRSVRVLEGVARDEVESHIDPSLGAQSYRLDAGPEGIRMVAGDDAGLFYAQATVEQLRRGYPEGLPSVEIQDHPDNAVRGVMLDVSRDKVPTLDTLKALIARLASWKVNHVQLYMEHTFAYEGHDEVWRHADPYTPDDIRDLDAFCREHHVELTPNQNCLGHMERWLRHERYRPLGLGEGWTDPLGRPHPPSTLDPVNPGSIALVEDILGQLLSCFTSRRVHVGLDEPFGLPEERMDEYVDYIDRVAGLDCLDGRDVLMWGEVLYFRPPLLEKVRRDLTLCVWWYEANPPFTTFSDPVRDAGLGFWVCPGTSSWLTLGGRITNAKGNIASAAEASADASGFLVTDWGDRGHLQYLPVSEPALAYAAATSWCLEENRDIDLAAVMDLHAFEDEAGEVGAALLELGDLYARVKPYVPNSSPLTVHLYYPERAVGKDFTDGLTVDDLEEVQRGIGNVRDALRRARPQRSDGGLVIDELTTTCALLALLCRDAKARLAGDGTLASVPEVLRQGLAEDLQPIIERHEAHWLARNRRGGLADSRGRLENLRRWYMEADR